MTTTLKSRPILTLRKPAATKIENDAGPRFVELRPRVLGPWWPNNGYPSPDWLIKHPTTGANEYCVLPNLKGPGLDLCSGAALLLYGEHWSRHNGYGYVHILKGHWRELGYRKQPELGPESLSRVAKFVSQVLKSKMRILCEFSEMKKNHRPLVVNGIVGTVWLELRFESTPHGREPYYSVITAIPKKQGAGSEIGRVI